MESLTLYVLIIVLQYILPKLRSGQKIAQEIKSLCKSFTIYRVIMNYSTKTIHSLFDELDCFRVHIVLIRKSQKTLVKYSALNISSDLLYYFKVLPHILPFVATLV